MFWVPKTILRFDDLLEGLRVFNIWLYSQLKFITVKGYKTTSAKDEGTWGGVEGKSGASIQESSPRTVT